jgi:hypothetical protein
MGTVPGALVLVAASGVVDIVVGSSGVVEKSANEGKLGYDGIAVREASLPSTVPFQLIEK